MNKRVYHPANKKTAKASQKEPSAGATTSGISQSAIFQAWLSHHRSSCRDSLLRLLNSPWQSLLTWLVVAIAVVLPASLYLGLNNIQQFGGDWQRNLQMSAFVNDQASPAAVEKLRQRLLLDPELADVGIITPEQARQEFQAYSGLGNVLDSLSDNPLPAVLTIQPAASTNSPEALSQLQQRLQAEPLIVSVQLDIAWLQRLYQIMDLAQRLVLALGVLLAIGVLLVIGNTIRLEIENRRDEIVVTKMVGGTDGFVRRPFLYTGFWYGIGGGIFALLLLLLARAWLDEPLQQLLVLYKGVHSLTWVAFDTSLLIIILSGLLGWLGAWLAVARHLRQVEPV